MNSEFQLGQHYFYVDWSSFVCKYCLIGFSVYDVDKKTTNYIAKLNCTVDLDIKTLIETHDFKLNESKRQYFCKYCNKNFFDGSLSNLYNEGDLLSCLSNEEKIIKDLLE